MSRYNARIFSQLPFLFSVSGKVLLLFELLAGVILLPLSFYDESGNQDPRIGARIILQHLLESLFGDIQPVEQLHQPGKVVLYQVIDVMRQLFADKRFLQLTLQPQFHRCIQMFEELFFHSSSEFFQHAQSKKSKVVLNRVLRIKGTESCGELLGGQPVYLFALQQPESARHPRHMEVYGAYQSGRG